MSINRDQWLEQRKNGIGGSDAAAILGLNPYMTNVQLWEIKTGRKEQEDISEKTFVKYGTEAEKPLRELFMLDYPEYDVVDKGYNIIKHPEYEFLFASLDGELINKKNQEKGILEIKTTNILQSMQMEKWNDQVPQNYFCQLLHYFLVTGYKYAFLKAHLKSIWGGETRITTRHYLFDRKDFEDDIEYLKQKEIEFWQKYVLADKQPNLVLPAI